MTSELPLPVFQPEHCKYRSDVRGGGTEELARCELLQEVSGVGASDLCRVRRDACEACCKSTPPTPNRINSVVASLLYGLTERVVAVEGVPGCDLGKAVGIRSWAWKNLLPVDGEENADYDKLLRRAARDCVYLGRAVGLRSASGEETDGKVQVFECLHPEHLETTASQCYWCREWTPEEGEKPALPRALTRPPQQGQGERVRQWAVGVTTSPRSVPTLGWCLDSLIRAGWSSPRLFMDAPVELAPRHRNLPVSLRETRVGAWPNFYLGLAELLMRDPEAAAFMMVQDDALFYDRQNLREILEDVLWLEGEVGAVSLYCSRVYAAEDDGWHVLEGKWFWGALAFVFPRESAKRFVTDLKVMEHRWRRRNRGCANVDVVVGEWAARCGLKIYFPTPSLVQHIGEVSTLWPTARATGPRRANRFAGDSGARIGDPVR